MFRRTKRKNSKEKMLLMFKNENRKKRHRFYDKSLGFVFGLALATTIVAAILFVLAMLAPIFKFVLLIITLGAVWISNPDYWNMNIEPFMSTVFWVAVIAAVVAAAAFALRFIFTRMLTMAEKRELKKDAQENRDYLAIAGAVGRIRIAQLIAFIVLIGAILSGVFVMRGAGGDAGNILGWTAVIIIIARPIIIRFYTNIQLRKVSASIAAVS